MTTAPHVYILILNYCDLEQTQECVECCRNLNYDNKTILVLDNASPDNSGEKLERDANGYRFIQTGANLGYAGGNNIGIADALNAGADHILILNPDTRPAPDCIWQLLNAFDESTAAVAPVQLNPDGSGYDPIFARLEGLPDFNEIDGCESIRADKLYGAAWLISAAAIRDAGSFDPLFECYSEEVDLCRRFRYHGYNLKFSLQARVRHLRPYLYTEDPERRLFKKYLIRRNKLLLTLKDPFRSYRRQLFKCMRLIVREYRKSIFRFDIQRARTAGECVKWFRSNFELMKERREKEIAGAREFPELYDYPNREEPLAAKRQKQT